MDIINFPLALVLCIELTCLPQPMAALFQFKSSGATEYQIEPHFLDVIFSSTPVANFEPRNEHCVSVISSPGRPPYVILGGSAG